MSVLLSSKSERKKSRNHQIHKIDNRKEKDLWDWKGMSHLTIWCIILHGNKEGPLMGETEILVLRYLAKELVWYIFSETSCFPSYRVFLSSLILAYIYVYLTIKRFCTYIFCKFRSWGINILVLIYIAQSAVRVVIYVLTHIAQNAVGVAMYLQTLHIAQLELHCTYKHCTLCSWDSNVLIHIEYFQCTHTVHIAHCAVGVPMYSYCTHCTLHSWCCNVLYPLQRVQLELQRRESAKARKRHKFKGSINLITKVVNVYRDLQNKALY